MSTENAGDSATAATEGINPDLTSTAGFEDLDEDRLGQDPLEEGMDPPEDWSASDRTGTTAREQREGESLDEKLDQEIPDEHPLTLTDPGRVAMFPRASARANVGHE